MQVKYLVGGGLTQPRGMILHSGAPSRENVTKPSHKTRQGNGGTTNNRCNSPTCRSNNHGKPDPSNKMAPPHSPYWSLLPSLPLPMFECAPLARMDRILVGCGIGDWWSTSLFQFGAIGGHRLEEHKDGSTCKRQWAPSTFTFQARSQSASLAPLMTPAKWKMHMSSLSINAAQVAGSWIWPRDGHERGGRAEQKEGEPSQPYKAGQKYAWEKIERKKI